MTVGSLFAGIGGFDLGFERAGFDIKWQVEIEGYATRVLAKHWPAVRRYGDIRAIDWADVEPVDVLVGGFPCQPHSSAGRRLAAADGRDLWPEYRRCIRALRPRGLRWVLAENVSGILSSDDGRFFGGILRDMAESGMRVEWDCLPASAFGAPHQRDRVWILAHADDQWELQPEGRQCDERRRPGDGGQDVADTNDQHGRSERRISSGDGSRPRHQSGGSGAPMADTDRSRLEGWLVLSERPNQRATGPSGVGDTDRSCASTDTAGGASRPAVGERGGWEPEPNVGRVAHGIPARVDRLRGLGNSIVPQIAEWIARRIAEAEGRA